MARIYSATRFAAGLAVLAGAALSAACAPSAVATQKPDGHPGLQAIAEDGQLTLKDLPPGLACALRETSRRLAALEAEAHNSLRLYLEHEQARRYKQAYGLLHSGLREAFARDKTNQAIINDIRLRQHPPAAPRPDEREAIERVEAMMKRGRLSLDVDDPALWAYEWTHWTGSCDAVFEATGPYANQYRLVGFHIVRVALAAEDLAVAWVDEQIEMPVAIRVVCLSQYLLKPEGGAWRIWGYRTFDGPRIRTWLGLNTCVWPDETAQEPGVAAETEALKQQD